MNEQDFFKAYPPANRVEKLAASVFFRSHCEDADRLARLVQLAYRDEEKNKTSVFSVRHSDQSHPARRLECLNIGRPKNEAFYRFGYSLAIGIMIKSYLGKDPENKYNKTILNNVCAELKELESQIGNPYEDIFKLEELLSDNATIRGWWQGGGG